MGDLWALKGLIEEGNSLQLLLHAMSICSQKNLYLVLFIFSSKRGNMCMDMFNLNIAGLHLDP